MDVENKKIVRVALAVVCILTAFVLNRGLVYLSNMTGVRNLMLFNIMPLSVLLGSLIALGIFVYLNKNEKSFGFLMEVVGELKKVVWPTKKETSMSTLVVVILVLITAVILWVFDWIWSSLIRLLI